jgi:predicted HicB family RNase H-like nuclease
LGQKYCKKLNLEIPHDLHAEILKQAKQRNITIRTFVLKYLLPAVIKNKNLYNDASKINGESDED